MKEYQLPKEEMAELENVFDQKVKLHSEINQKFLDDMNKVMDSFKAALEELMIEEKTNKNGGEKHDI